MLIGFCLTAVFVVLTCACAFMCVRAQINRKERYRAAARNAVEKLPDRENSYLRSRLSGALAAAKDGKLPTDACLLYTRKLLKKLTEKKLSGADVLMARRLQKQIVEYAEKELVSPHEKERLPLALTSVLNLCAKYEVGG